METRLVGAPVEMRDPIGSSASSPLADGAIAPAIASNNTMVAIAGGAPGAAPVSGAIDSALDSGSGENGRRGQNLRRAQIARKSNKSGIAAISQTCSARADSPSAQTAPSEQTRPIVSRKLRRGQRIHSRQTSNN